MIRLHEFVGRNNQTSSFLIAFVLAVSSLAGCEHISDKNNPKMPEPSHDKKSEPNTGVNAKPGSGSVNILAWVGYDERDFLEKLESRTGVRVNVKTYVGGDRMYSLFKSAPAGTYDLVVVDREYGSRLFAEKALCPIDPNQVRKADLLEPFASTSVAVAADTIYAVPVRWGALGLVYNSRHIPAEDVSSYGVLFDKRFAKRVGIFDWYLPTMGVLARYASNKNAWSNESSFNLTRQQLDALTAMLKTLRPQVRSVQPSTGDVIASLRSGAVWVAPGVGEWAAASLQEEGIPVEWCVPSEGGVMWIEALAVTPNGTERPEAQKVFDAFQDPEVLASLMWRKAYVSQSPSRKAYSYLSDSQRHMLKAEDLNSLEAMATQLEIRCLPGPLTGPDEWQAAWQCFKAQ